MMYLILYFLVYSIEAVRLRGRSTSYSNCPYEGLTDSTFNSPECAERRYLEASVALKQLNTFYKDLIAAYINGTTFVKSLTAHNNTLETMRNVLMGPTGSLGSLMDESVVGSLYRGASIVWNASKSLDQPVKSLINESYSTAISFRDAWRRDSGNALTDANDWVVKQDALVQVAKNALEQTILNNYDLVLRAVLTNATVVNATLKEANENITNLASNIATTLALYSSNTTSSLAKLTSDVNNLDVNVAGLSAAWPDEFEKIINLPLTTTIDQVYIPKLRTNLTEVITSLTARGNEANQASKQLAVDILDDSRKMFGLSLNETKNTTDRTGFPEEIQGYLTESTNLITEMATDFKSRSTTMFSNLTNGVMADKNHTYGLSSALNLSRIDASDWGTNLPVLSGNLTTLVESERLTRLNEAKNLSLAAANSTFNALLQNVNEAFLMRQKLMLEADTKKSAMSSILARLSEALGGSLGPLMASLEDLSNKVGGVGDGLSDTASMGDGANDLATDIMDKTNSAATGLATSTIETNAAMGQDALEADASIAAMESESRTGSALTEQTVKANLALEAVEGEQVALDSANRLRNASNLIEVERSEVNKILNEIDFLEISTASQSSEAHKGVAEAAQLISSTAEAMLSEFASFRAVANTTISTALASSDTRFSQALADKVSDLKKRLVDEGDSYTHLNASFHETLHGTVNTIAQLLDGISNADEVKLAATGSADDWDAYQRDRLKTLATSTSQRGDESFAAAQDALKQAIVQANQASLIHNEFEKLVEAATLVVDAKKSAMSDFTSKHATLNAALRSTDDALAAKVAKITESVDFDQGAAFKTVQDVDALLQVGRSNVQALLTSVTQRAARVDTSIAYFNTTLNSTLQSVKHKFVSDSTNLTNAAVLGLQAAKEDVDNAFSLSLGAFEASNSSQNSAVSALHTQVIADDLELRDRINAVARAQRDNVQAGAFVPIAEMISEISFFYQKWLSKKSDEDALLASTASATGESLNSASDKMFNQTTEAGNSLSIQVETANNFISQVGTSGDSAVSTTTGLLEAATKTVKESEQALLVANAANQDEAAALNAALQANRAKMNTALSEAFQTVGTAGVTAISNQTIVMSAEEIQAKFATLLSTWSPYAEQALGNVQKLPTTARDAEALNDAKIQAETSSFASILSSTNQELNESVQKSNGFFRETQRSAKAAVAKFNLAQKIHNTIHASVETMMRDLRGNASEVLQVANGRLQGELEAVQNAAADQEAKWNLAIDSLTN